MLLLLLHPPVVDTSVVSGAVGPVAAAVALLGFDHFEVGDARDGWSAGDAHLGYELTVGDARSGWQTGDATT